MNDVTTAIQGKEEERMDAQDFVEMGSVTEGTKGSLSGDEWDGGMGRWYS